MPLRSLRYECMMVAACCSAEGEHRVGGLDLLIALYVSTGTIYLIQLIEFLPAAALLKVMKRPCAYLA